MHWASTLESEEQTEAATRAAAESIERSMGGRRVDLLLAFVSPHHADRYAAVPALLRQRFPGAAILGCSAAGVIAAGHEAEERPAIAVLAAELPDVDVHVFHTDTVEDAPDADGWRALIGVEPAAAPALIVIPEPFGVAGEAMVDGLDEAYPHSAKVGAVASGGREPGEIALFADGFVHRRGVVGVALTGDIAMDTLVAQGARPVGPVLTITGARGNLLVALDGEPAIDVLGEVFESLPVLEQRLFQRQPMIGVGAGASGESLVRGILGVHRPSSVVAVGFPAEVGQQVQFHVRDAASAHAELRILLERYAAQHPEGSPAGVVQFSCVGRGRGFFGTPDHDVALLREVLGPVSVGGFFGNGELGPIRGRTHMHGYTSAFGLFRPAGWN